MNDSLQKVAGRTYPANRSGDNENDPANCTVSLDGLWQTRGFSSVNGVVTRMPGNKCIDLISLQKHAEPVQYGKRKAKLLKSMLNCIQTTLVS